VAGILSCESGIYRVWCPSLSTHPCYYLHANITPDISQATKDVPEGQDTLDNVFTVFERIESYFRRHGLVAYAEVPPTTEMIVTIIRIIVEILSIIGIATREIKQGRMSK
jgi:hypothetical protein